MKAKILIARRKIGGSILLLLFLFYAGSCHIKWMPDTFSKIDQLEKVVTWEDDFGTLPENADSGEEPANLYAKSALLMDAVSKRVLFEKNGYEVLPMASTTKIMTCIYVLENSDLEQLVTVSSDRKSVV